jgi:hypothetical protein
MGKTVLTLLFILAPLSLSAANFDMIQREQAHELNAALVTVPSSPTGYLFFKACPDCRVVSLQVDHNTKYILGRERVTLREFRKYGVRRGNMYVFYEPESNIVTRVRLREGSRRRGRDD